jgi:hypothetical protein
VRRAALAHDLGRVGVSNAIWKRPRRLGFGEWERVRLQPHFTERAFAQSRELAPIGILAGSPTNGWTALATTAARAGRDSIRPPPSSPPPTATAPCARRGRTNAAWEQNRELRKASVKQREAETAENLAEIPQEVWWRHTAIAPKSSSHGRFRRAHACVEATLATAWAD